MRFRPRRDRHRDTRKAFARHDMHTSSQQSAARCSRLGRQIDSEISSVKLAPLSQELPKLTAHFYGKYAAGDAACFSAQCGFGRFACAARNSVGDCPVSFLKTRLNWERDWKPTANAISLTRRDRKSTRLNSSHVSISYAV